MVWSVTTYDDNGNMLFGEYRTDWCEALELFDNLCSDCGYFHDPYLIKLIEYGNNREITVLVSFDNRGSNCRYFRDPHLFEPVEYGNDWRMTMLESFDNYLET